MRSQSWPSSSSTSSVCCGELGRHRPRRPRRAAEVDRRGDHLDRLAAVDRDGHEAARGSGMRVVDGLVGVLHRRPPHVLAVEDLGPTRRAVLVAKMALSSRTSSAELREPGHQVGENRSSSAHSGRSTARSTSGQWRSPWSPSIQNRLPSPAS